MSMMKDNHINKEFCINWLKNRNIRWCYDYEKSWNKAIVNWDNDAKLAWLSQIAFNATHKVKTLEIPELEMKWNAVI